MDHKGEDVKSKIKYTKKAVWLAVISFLLVMEIFSGTFGGIRWVEYSQDVSLKDYMENDQFEVLQGWTVEVVAELATENDVYTIGRYGYFPGRITRENALQSIKKQAENMEVPDGKDEDLGEIEYDQLHLKRMEIWLPYIGAWKSKRILNRMEKAGLVEKNGWYPFFALLIPR